MKTLEFRDGEQDVPDHVAMLMTGIETHTMTYAEAIKASEQKLLRDRLNDRQGSIVAEHMRRVRPF